MRRAFLITVLTFGSFATMIAVGRAAERDWQTGTWGKAPAGRAVSPTHAYVIETDDFEYQVQETVARGSQPLTATAGQPVTFALDANDKNGIYVREGADGERSLRLVRATRKLRIYSAAGPGHYIRAMADDGLTLILEDGSVWSLDPRAQYQTRDWQPREGISVRYGEQEPGFNYELDDDDRDEGALAILTKAP